MVCSTDLAGCQQQEEPQPQYLVPESQYPILQSQLPAPSEPIQTQGEVQMLKDVLCKDPVKVKAWIKLVIS